LEFCRRRGVPTDVPFARLAPKWQDWVIQGDPDYGKDAAHRWPLAWYGVQGYFRWLESKAYKMHVRVLLARYRSYQACPACQGQRLQPEALFYRLESPVRSSIGGQKLASLTLADFYHLPLQEAWPMTQALAARYAAQPHDPVGLALQEVCSRLGYLVEIGLGYLALDRPTRTLSGGETERVNLATCLGSRLVSTLFVLDEPSVGLHPRDTERLVRILKRLRDAGNTVVVVEHEASVIQAADHIVDLGPGHGETGGEVVFQGGYARLLDCPGSLTGLYLSGQRRIELPVRRPVCSAEPGPREPADGDGAFLTLSQATRYNLRDLTVRIPLARFVCVAGVSGSGKTTLVREILLPALESKLRRQQPPPPAEKQSSEAGEEEKEDDARLRGQPAQLTGWERLGRVVLVDQGPIGKTPRSNPALYVGAFDHLRKLFAESEDARRRGLTPGAFSFNSAEGRCERCHGAGFEKIEMQFLSDVFIRCPDCDGRRYRPHVLEARLRPQLQRQPGQTALAAPDSGLNIAGLLEATVDEAVAFLAGFRGSPAGEAALASLELLRAVGLGYLRLGQPINTLSGGEAQRLKLASHLKEMKWTPGHRAEGRQPRRLPLSKPTLFLFDEPTTGLHFDDVRVLLQVFQRLVEAGHSVLVIEHNLDVIKAADWVIDLGPEAGEQGGQLVAEGTPEMIAACPKSHTGAALQKIGVPAVRGNCGA
jgi:excinuclease ABC subunit A